MINSKVVIKDSKKPGPKVVVMAGVHGDEICGVKALDELIPKIKVTAGKVTFIYANLKAIEQNKRFIEYNLNRCFSSDQAENVYSTLEGKTGRELVRILDDSDVLLDLHASTSKKTVPFIICEKQSYAYANVLPFKFVVGGFDFVYPGASDHYMNQNNKPALCVECGYLGDKSTIKVAKNTVLTFLKKAGSIRGKAPTLAQKKFFEVNFVYKNKFGPFRLSRDFADFEELSGSTVVGFDGQQRAFAEDGDLLLFARSEDKLNSECFVIGKRKDKK
ncbi:MAG: succinylglutamate desuccinylase/aspartoacylase family protein [archaeon]|jgi:predicted deacylase